MCVHRIVMFSHDLVARFLCDRFCGLVKDFPKLESETRDECYGLVDQVRVDELIAESQSKYDFLFLEKSWVVVRKLICNAIVDIYFARNILSHMNRRTLTMQKFDNHHRALSACASIIKRSIRDIDAWTTLICYDLVTNLASHVI